MKRFVGNPAERWRGQPHTTPSTGREEPLDRGLIANDKLTGQKKPEKGKAL